MQHGSVVSGFSASILQANNYPTNPCNMEVWQIALVLTYNDTCHSFNKTHIIMTSKLTHHGGQIIYVIYIYFMV